MEMGFPAYFGDVLLVKNKSVYSLEANHQAFIIHNAIITYLMLRINSLCVNLVHQTMEFNLNVNLF